MNNIITCNTNFILCETCYYYFLEQSLIKIKRSKENMKITSLNEIIACILRKKIISELVLTS